MPHHDPHLAPDLAAWLVAAINQLDAKISRVMYLLIRQGVKEMATLQDIQDAVSHETDVEQAAVTLLQELSGELQAAVAAGDPNKMQQLADAINANANALARAIVQNTPASSSGGTATGPASGGNTPPAGGTTTGPTDTTGGTDTTSGTDTATPTAP
jgi:hypothetical protein